MGLAGFLLLACASLACYAGLAWLLLRYFNRGPFRLAKEILASM